VTGGGVVNADAIARPEDEYPHPLPSKDDPRPWKDTWWFSFHDGAAGLTGVLHLTLSANRPPGFRLAAALGWGSRRFLRTWYTTPTVTADAVDGGVVRLRIVEPEWSDRKRLELTFDLGGVTGELQWSGRHFGPDLARLTPGLLPGDAQMLGHAPQAAHVAGRIEWDGDALTVDADGFRDRSWGYRKSDSLTPFGYTYAALLLPEAAMGLMALHHPGPAAPAGLVGGWFSDRRGVLPLVGGDYHRSADGRPSDLGFHLADGRTVTLAGAQPQADVLYPYHEPEMDGAAVGILCADQYVRFDSGDGPAIGVFNHGVPFMADVFRGARFCAG